jgi:hypothetical protein
MLAAMRPRHLGEWAALARLSPWGESRADLRAGIVAAIIANTHRDPKRKAAPFRPKDFMPFHEEEDPDRLAARIWGSLDRLRKRT